MNSSIFIFMLIIVGCGVKGAPIAKNQAPPSAIENEYPELNLEPGSILKD